MSSRLGRAVLVGIVTFFLSYVILVGFSMVSFSYFSGPIPDLLLAIPLPLLLATFAAVFAYLRADSN